MSFLIPRERGETRVLLRLLLHTMLRIISPICKHLRSSVSRHSLGESVAIHLTLKRVPNPHPSELNDEEIRNKTSWLISIHQPPQPLTHSHPVSTTNHSFILSHTQPPHPLTHSLSRPHRSPLVRQLFLCAFWRFCTDFLHSNNTDFIWPFCEHSSVH